MIIPSRNIPDYFHCLEFPVTVFDESKITVAYVADRETLDSLIADEHVIAIGTPSRIRRICLNKPLSAVVSEQRSSKAITVSAYLGTRYVTREWLGNGQKVWKLRHITPEMQAVIHAPVLECLR